MEYLNSTIYLIGQAKKLDPILEGFYLGDRSETNFKDLLEWMKESRSASPSLSLVDAEELFKCFQDFSSLHSFLLGREGVILFFNQKGQGTYWQDLQSLATFIPGLWGLRLYPESHETPDFLAKDLQVLQRHILEKYRFKNELYKLSGHLQGLTQEVDREVERVKGLHRKFIPRRFEEIKGISFAGKFQAGSSPGGDFYDLIKKGNKIIFIMSHGRSYLYTNAIIHVVSQLKKAESFKNLELSSLVIFIEQALAENPPKALEAQLLLMSIDLSKMQIEGHMYGHYHFLSSKKMDDLVVNDYPLNSAFLQKTLFHHKLEREEKMLWISPGLWNQWSEKEGLKRLKDFVRLNQNMSQQDLLEEVFIQLKMKTEGDFLDVDAALVGLEVSNNIMIEV